MMSAHDAAITLAESTSQAATEKLEPEPAEPLPTCALVVGRGR